MAHHSKHNAPTLRSLSKRQWIRISTAMASVGLVVAGVVATQSMYSRAEAQPTPSATAYSITESNHAASRGNAREAMDGDTSYVTVKVNGKSRVVLGQDFTDVKSVLDAGDITLEPGDQVNPSLTTKVDESTTISIERQGAKMETTESKIPFNTVKKDDPSLPKGTEKVQTEGEEGILEKTNLVTRTGDKVVSSNTFATWVKKAPVEKVVLVGTGNPQPAATSAPAQTEAVGAEETVRRNGLDQSGISDVEWQEQPITVVPNDYQE